MPDESTSLATQMSTVRVWLEQQQPELEKVLKPQGMDATRFARVALTAVLRQPQLARCDKASFVLAIMEAAALGLEPDSVSGLGYIIPFGGKAQFIAGYRGLIQRAYDNPRVLSIEANAVFEKDHFGFTKGLRSSLVHEEAPPPRGELVAAYAIARLRGGATPFEWCWREEIEQHRARSRAKDSGPWATDTVAMSLRIPIRKLMKFIPAGPRLQAAMALDTDPEHEPAPGSPSVAPGTQVSEILDAIATAEASEPEKESYEWGREQA